MYYNGIKIASFIRDGVWIRENAEDYHQVFFKDVFYIELLPYQEELINDMIKENQNEEKEIY